MRLPFLRKNFRLFIVLQQLPTGITFSVANKMSRSKKWCD